MWPAELVADLLHQHEMYQQHDARFEPQQVVHLVGELMARMRAIASGTRVAPQLMIRGTPSDRPTEIAAGRMIGVGLGVRPGQRHATLSAYLQDADSGSVVAVERTFADPDPKSGDCAAQLHRLGCHRRRPRRIAGRSRVLATAAQVGQAHAQRRADPAAHGREPVGQPAELPMGTAQAAVCRRELAQLSARFASLPPSYLRPRRQTENLHAVAVAAAENATFDVSASATDGRLARRAWRHGPAGTPLPHPWPRRLRRTAGSAAAARAEVRFVCGHVRAAGRTLEIYPISVIVDDGTRRLGLQPWVSNNLAANEGGSEPAVQAVCEQSAVEHFSRQLGELLSDLLLTGVTRSDGTRWGEQAELGRQLGFVRLVAPVADLADSLNSQASTLRWAPTAAVQHARELCFLSRIIAE